MKATLKISALALCLGLAAPALANDQNQANTANGNSASVFSNTEVANDLIDIFVQENGPATLSESYSESYQSNNNTKVAAYQELHAVNTNHHLDEVVDLDGEDDSPTAVGYNSGSNSVNDNAFAAFAGIANQAWNTGINANTQAATNIAAQGTVNFGVSQGAAAAGGGGGDAD
ncbi:hypothetical protein [Sphingorhabdus sp.]|uniref:hypothetical protein n=1 Tax=Sphingorhabdus sp. TaxID=1902408 RepID=UPI0035ADDC84|nr:hypothetical protein [Sphingomonadaceae bacterium]